MRFPKPRESIVYCPGAGVTGPRTSSGVHALYFRVALHDVAGRPIISLIEPVTDLSDPQTKKGGLQHFSFPRQHLSSDQLLYSSSCIAFIRFISSKFSSLPLHWHPFAHPLLFGYLRSALPVTSADSSDPGRRLGMDAAASLLAFLDRHRVSSASWTSVAGVLRCSAVVLVVTKANQDLGVLPPPAPGPPTGRNSELCPIVLSPRWDVVRRSKAPPCDTLGACTPGGYCFPAGDFDGLVTHKQLRAREVGETR